MSDKAKKYLESIEGYNIECIQDDKDLVVAISEVMQSYAEQHLENVLVEAEKEINNLYQPSGMHEFYTAGFEEGAKWLLNHLKQRKG